MLRSRLAAMAGCVVSLGVGVVLAFSASAASAASAGPGWAIHSVALPTNFSQADSEVCENGGGAKCDAYLVMVTNVGTKPSVGTAVVKDTLPPDIVVERINEAKDYESREPLSCTNTTSSVQCTDAEPVIPGDTLMIEINVRAAGPAESSATNEAEVEGGEAATATTSEPSTVANTVNGEAPPFGAQDFSVGVFGSGGASDVQAGDHPNTLTTTIDYTTGFNGANFVPFGAVEEAKTEIVDLPLGFFGDPLAAEQCSESDLLAAHCPADSVIGIAALVKDGAIQIATPGAQRIYNMVPEPGYPALFAFEYGSAEVFLRARVVPSPSGYMLSVSVPEVPRATRGLITGAALTFFGDPAEQDGGGNSPAAFFTNPTDCSAGPLEATLEMDSWVNPQRWVSNKTTVFEASPTRAVSGCNMLQFDPTIELKPEEAQADTASGYEVDLRVPQAPNISPGLATPELKDAEVTLPEGVSVSPGAADGLAGCREVGPEGINITHGWMPTGEQPIDPADPEAMEIAADGLPHVARGHCPAASQIGTVEIATPLLREKLEGHVYLAQPKCGGEGQPPCTEASAVNGELFGLYLEAEGSGVIVKLSGEVSANPSTGRLTTRFRENPQLPFSELKLQLTGGPRAPLANPQTCGNVTTTSDLTPWSAPVTPDATPFSSFAVTGCANPMPFAPTFSAGTVTSNAAASSPLTLTFSRHDGEQDFSAISVTTPPGLVGMLSQVPLCEESQAAAGTCPEASRIGTTTVAAGAGSHPFWIGGQVYLTGPYNGAPFGLSVVVPAKAGPFNLGNVVVRSAINIDPSTSAITVTSGPLPQIRDGVPFRLKTVNVTIDRPGFMLNPTNCEQQSITATIAAAQGARGTVSSPFAVGGCKNLPFKPSFTVSTQAKTSKANGASLDVKVAYPGSGQANIKSVKVDLPVQLPSRLTTLQKACTAAVFEANPAHCPAESIVGIAKAQTPVLPVTLTGPAYLVSHGGAAFPDLVVILQGEGVRVDLIGQTLIRKGVTSSNFASIPDVPVSSFELYLPEGRYSALTATGSLCAPTTTVTKRVRVAHRVRGRVRHALKTVTQTVRQPLMMPIAITGQNGAVIKQTTPVKVTGCPKARKAKAARRGRKPIHAHAAKRREQLMGITRLSRTGLATLSLLAGGFVSSSPASATPPEKPLTVAASAITATTATLHGELNPGLSSEKLNYAFAYKIGASCSEGSLAPEPLGEAEGNHKAVSVALTGLEPSIQYTYCLTATNPEAEEESASGAPLSFTTLGAPPAVDAQSESGVTPFDAVLEGQVNPENQAATYDFEYANNPALTGATSIGEESLPGVSEDQTAGPVDIGGGLEPATVYYYRVVATNATGTTDGATQQFTTLAAEKPLIEEESASAITQTTASLSAAINPEFQETTCKAFQYVDEATFHGSGYGSAAEVPCEPEGLGSGSEPMTASANSSGLTANTTYHFRVLAENVSGLSEGPDQTFFTLPNPPKAITGQTSSTTPNSATISGSVNPGSVGPNSDTTYFFQYGPTTSYGAQAPLAPGDAGEGTSPVSETANLTGLESGTSYHYRIVATNDNANTPQTVFGADQTFMTGPTPPILSAVFVSAITQSSATFTATLDPQGLPTRYELQVGSAPGAVQAQAVGNTAGASVISLALNVGSLSPGTLYYYRLVATNLNGTAEPPPEGAFTTAAGPGASSPLAQPPTAPLLATPTTTFPRESPNGVLGTKTKGLTNAQKLAKALKACKKKPKSKRASCGKQARRKYGPSKKKKKTKKIGNAHVS